MWITQALIIGRVWVDRLRADGGRGGMSDEVSYTALLVAAAVAAGTFIAAGVLAKVFDIEF